MKVFFLGFFFERMFYFICGFSLMFFFRNLGFKYLVLNVDVDNFFIIYIEILSGFIYREFIL